MAVSGLIAVRPLAISLMVFSGRDPAGEFCLRHAATGQSLDKDLAWLDDPFGSPWGLAVSRHGS